MYKPVIKPQKLKDRFMEFVLLSPEEYGKLKDRFGEKELNEKIEGLNNYIGSRGFQRKYKSHYHVILTWHNKAEKEKRKKEIIYNLPQEKPVQPRTVKRPDSPKIQAIRTRLAETSERINRERSWGNPEERALLVKLQRELREAENGTRLIGDLI